MAINRNLLVGIYDSQGDIDAVKYFNRVTNNGGSISSSGKNSINTFVVNLKKNNLWNLVNDMSLFVGVDNLFGSSGNSVIKLKTNSSSISLTNYNFIPSTDYISTGSTAGIRDANNIGKFLDSLYNPNTQSDSTSNFGMFAYVKGTEASGNTRVIMGASDGGEFGTTNATRLGWVNAGALEGGTISSSTLPSEYTPSGVGNVGVGRDGALMLTSNGSRTNRFYQNGTEINTAVSSSASFSNRSLFVGAEQAASSTSFYCRRYMRGYAITLGMSASQVITFSTLWNTLMASFGANTY
jgi:hypothetical protein